MNMIETDRRNRMGENSLNKRMHIKINTPNKLAHSFLREAALLYLSSERHNLRRLLGHRHADEIFGISKMIMNNYVNDSKEVEDERIEDAKLYARNIREKTKPRLDGPVSAELVRPLAAPTTLKEMEVDPTELPPKKGLSLCVWMFGLIDLNTCGQFI
jgi:hypothetical protein